MFTNRVKTQARILGCLAVAVKRISLHASILQLFLLGAFEPLQMSSLILQGSFSSILNSPSVPWWRLHLKKFVSNPDKALLDIPELQNQQILFEPCRWLPERMGQGQGRRPGDRVFSGDRCQLNAAPLSPGCPKAALVSRLPWASGWLKESRSLGM